MFGYVKPLECELKVKEYRSYQAAYCGLCKAIRKRHGYFASSALSYDCAFLALLLSALYDEKIEYKKCRCIHRCNQSGKTFVLATPAYLYAGDCNILLSYYKCRDDGSDEKKLSAKLAAFLLKDKVRRIEKRLPHLCRSVEQRLLELSKLEAEKCTDADATADCFAKLLCDLAAYSPYQDAAGSEPLRWLMYNLGRWIYLIDAADDMEKDREKGSYNPFNAANRSKDELDFPLYKSLEQANNGLALLELKRDAELIENIIAKGCVYRTELVLKEKQDESL
ncbi:MAG: DUF5685 family protein [Clostridia bacterium]|nr:DUF5685 family protein [Clostridia bacterium]